MSSSLNSEIVASDEQGQGQGPRKSLTFASSCAVASTSIRNNGTFRWDNNKDISLLQEVLFQEPFLERVGSKESGSKWSEIASSLNTYEGFKDNPRDQRSVRERFNKLFSDFKSKQAKEVNASGGNPADPSEADTLLEEIKEKIISAKSDSTATPAVKETDRGKALSMRHKAMVTWGKNQKNNQDDIFNESDSDESIEITNSAKKKRKRRSGVDAVAYLQKRYESESEIRKEEMALKREQLLLEQARLDVEKNKQDLQQQQIQQQQQVQAQNQAMIIALLSNIAK